MSRDEIIKLARVAGVNTDPDIMAVMERFAIAVAAIEREACAKVADDYPHGHELKHHIANAIRARIKP